MELSYILPSLNNQKILGNQVNRTNKSRRRFFLIRNGILYNFWGKYIKKVCLARYEAM
jgi:hypothetical protein